MNVSSIAEDDEENDVFSPAETTSSYAKGRLRVMINNQISPKNRLGGGNKIISPASGTSNLNRDSKIKTTVPAQRRYEQKMTRDYDGLNLYEEWKKNPLLYIADDLGDDDATIPASSQLQKSLEWTGQVRAPDPYRSSPSGKNKPLPQQNISFRSTHNAKYRKAGAGGAPDFSGLV